MTSARVKEVIVILQQIYALGIPVDYPPMKELSARLNTYLKTEEGWAGSIAFPAYHRSAEIVLPSRADRSIQIRMVYKE